MVKMADYTPIVAGIDVSKAHLDAYLHPQGLNARFSNDKIGWRLLCAWLAKGNPETVVFEPTGPYHRAMERYVHDKGFAVARLDPRRARRFAEALGINVKTDPVDARVLARFGAYLKPAAAILPAQNLEHLKELVAARRGLVQQRTRCANKAKTATTHLLQKQLRQTEKLVRQHIQEIDDACRTIVRDDPGLSIRYDIVTSIPGIGDVSAMTLLADMPELGTMDAKQAASLLGAAPVAFESGTFIGKRHIRGGRALVRQAMYMAALVAARYNEDMKQKYHDLIKNGKPPKVALTAIMRKLIVLANALLRDQRKWAEIRACA